jgi:hypothetical protein
MSQSQHATVMPAKAGFQYAAALREIVSACVYRIPAFAGMTLTVASLANKKQEKQQ